MHREIGRTGVTVNGIGFGAWQLSNRNRPDERTAVDVLCAAVENGAQLIDTADCYARDDTEFGHNERLVGLCLKKLKSHDVKVATKVGFRRPGGAWIPDGRPERIAACCDDSLSRLGVEEIFLYQLHTPDPKVALPETLGAMAALQKSGKVRHLGLSNVSKQQLQALEGEFRIETVQNECNPWANKDVRNGLLDYCGQSGIAYLPYHPLGSKDHHGALSRDARLSKLAAKLGASTYRILLGWLLALGPHVIPIPGSTKIANVLDNLEATRLELGAEDIAVIGGLGK